MRSMSSLTGTFVWNLGPSFADGVGRALWWHSTTSLPTSWQMPEPFDRLRRPDGLSSMEILWVWLRVRIEREKFEMSLFVFEWGRARPLGLVSVISP